jgi:hypothetical protein
VKDFLKKDLLRDYPRGKIEIGKGMVENAGGSDARQIGLGNRRDRLHDFETSSQISGMFEQGCRRLEINK